MMSGDLKQRVPYAMGSFVLTLFIFFMHYVFRKGHIAQEAETARTCTRDIRGLLLILN